MSEPEENLMPRLTPYRASIEHALEEAAVEGCDHSTPRLAGHRRVVRTIGRWGLVVPVAFSFFVVVVVRHSLEYNEFPRRPLDE